MTDKPTPPKKIYKCQVCRTRVADRVVHTSDGKKMHRCKDCAELKNRIGFTNRVK